MVFGQPPAKWDKARHIVAFGPAKRFALKDKSDIIPLYIGDDVTDEDTRSLENKGITVELADLKTRARNIYLKNTDEVLSLKDIKRWYHNGIIFNFYGFLCQDY